MELLHSPITLPTCHLTYLSSPTSPLLSPLLTPLLTSPHLSLLSPPTSRVQTVAATTPSPFTTSTPSTCTCWSTWSITCPPTAGCTDPSCPPPLPPPASPPHPRGTLGDIGGERPAYRSNNYRPWCLVELVVGPRRRRLKRRDPPPKDLPVKDPEWSDYRYHGIAGVSDGGKLWGQAMGAIDGGWERRSGL